LFAKTQTFLDKKGQHKPFLRYFIKVFFLKGGEIATQQQAFTQLVIDHPPRTPQRASYAAEPGSSFGPRAKRT
jgi:hypothetical protein